ncbi:MAG: hypothetical protein HY886_01800 [Deltaproteobacteria bacterium]|nr:hypothetical protein [Deltaproteobacteria bacterium]
MRRPVRWSLWVVIPVSLILVFAVTVAVLIPDDVVEATLRHWLEGRGAISFSSKTFKKTLLLGPAIEMEGVTMTWRGNEPLIAFDVLSARPDATALFYGGLGVSANGFIKGKGKGVVKLRLWTSMIRRGYSGVDLTISDLAVADVPALSMVGLKGAGIGSASSAMTIEPDECPAGTVAASFTDMDVSGLAIPGLPLMFDGKVRADLSLEAVREAQGRKGRCKASLKRLTVETDGLSAKVHGALYYAFDAEAMTIKPDWNESDLTVELEPRTEDKRLALSALLPQHRVTANFYSIKLKGLRLPQ